MAIFLPSLCNLKLTRLHPRPPSKDIKTSGYILRLVLATPEKENRIHCNMKRERDIVDGDEIR